MTSATSFIIVTSISCNAINKFDSFDQLRRDSLFGNIDSVSILVINFIIDDICQEIVQNISYCQSLKYANKVLYNDCIRFNKRKIKKKRIFLRKKCLYLFSKILK